MRKNIALFGAVGVSACIAAASAQAKLIRYEINGQRYSYSTNNRQQTKEARERIAAAAAAESATARATAEAAANPLVRLFGSPTQREATEAKDRVQQVVPPEDRVQQIVPAEVQTEVASTSSVGRAGAERRRSVQRAAPREQARAVRQASLDRSEKIETGRGQPAAGPGRATRNEGSRISETPASSSPLTPTVEAAPGGPVVPLGRAIDAGTTGDAGGGSLTDFVNQVRRAPPETPPRL